MARIFRLWEKKRGDRRTGSKLVGTLGEALFFGILFLLGSVSLTYLIVTHVRAQNPETLELGSGYGFWLMVVVAASFVLIGGGGLILTVLQVGTSAERRSALAKRAANLDLMGDAPSAPEFPHVPPDGNLTNSPGVRLRYRLPVTQFHIWSLTLAAAFCLIWNGILSVLLTVVITSLADRQPDWFLTAFAVPSLAIGTWSIYNFAKQMLAHTGVGPTQVEISDHPLRPGGQYQVVVSQGGRIKLKWLELSLVCEEEATFHQGTDVRTESRAVSYTRMALYENLSIDPGTPFEHLGELQVPSQAMHSFRGKCNAIHWKLVVRGGGARWQQFDRSFPIVVIPMAADARHGGPTQAAPTNNVHGDGRADSAPLVAARFSPGPAPNPTAGVEDRS